MKNYKDERIVVIGLGVTGLSCVDFFHSRGVAIRVMDTRTTPPGLKALPINIPYHLGSLNTSWLLNATLIVKSPGISILHPALSLAISTGIPVISDIEIFAREKSTPVVAITGSNGKTTVSHMVRQMAALSGKKVKIGGNSGLPALKLLDVYAELFVLELSSFQLENTYSLHTEAATVLNISEDHMDRYPFGLNQYQQTKLRIYNNASVCVFNAEDNLTHPIKKHGAQLLSFGAQRGDYYLKKAIGRTWITIKGRSVLDCSEISVSGHHNYLNALAALALANSVGIPYTSSLSVLRNFRGLPHRFELVHDHHGVRWINDSKSTNVGSTKAALHNIQISGTLHLLLGGDGKSADFTPLLSLLESKRVQLYCFGKDALQLASLLPRCSVLTRTLEHAMRIVRLRVQTGDVVLLSPACSSLDQFTNFEIRGETFTRLARKAD